MPEKVLSEEIGMNQEIKSKYVNGSKDAKLNAIPERLERGSNLTSFISTEESSDDSFMPSKFAKIGTALLALILVSILLIIFIVMYKKKKICNKNGTISVELVPMSP